MKGLPTEEIYDLFEDSKGYIWVSHSLGISRYDGQSFTNFSCPDQTALGTTRICEDQQGRIWCHNFNGQIFYIQQEQMQVLTQYDPALEINFPDIVIKDSELIATSAKGLFVCNTRTMQCRYLQSASGKAMSRSLSTYNKAIITFGSHTAAKYDPKRGLIDIPVIPMKGLVYDDRNKSIMLTSIHNADTLYAYNNETNEIFRLKEQNDTLFIISITKITGLINTITKVDNKIWVNTKQVSFLLNGKEKLVNQNITDLVKDKTGNLWISSLQEGLKVGMVYKGWQKKEISFLPKGDFIRSMLSWQKNSIYGTQRGQVIVLHNNKLITSFQLPANAGSAERLFMLPNNRLLIAPSLGLYVANIELHKLYSISDIGTAKGITITDTSILLAYAQTLAKIPISAPLNEFIHSATSTVAKEDSFMAVFKDGVKIKEKYLRDTRCYLVDFNPVTKKTFVIFKTGLSELVNDSLVDILFEKNPIRATTLLQHDNALYVGSLNNGLFIKKPGLHFANINSQSGLLSNTILKMKLFDKKLVLVEPGYLQILDISTDSFVTTIALPDDNAGTVFDFLLDEETVHLTFSNSLFVLRFSDMISNPPSAFILSAIIAGKGKHISVNKELSNSDNNIAFTLSSPSFINPESTYFLYRLIGTNDNSWKRINGPIYSISFASLKPGTYRLESYAVNFQGMRSKNTLLYPFTIKKTWWQQPWLYIILILFLLAVSLITIKIRLGYVRKKDAEIIEKLNLQSELRKSLLTSIKTQMNPHFIFNSLNTIQSFIYSNDKKSASNYMGKFSEIIRKVLDNSSEQEISMAEEIEILQLYIDIEKARFGSDLSIQIEVDPQLDANSIYLPPMLIQPYVENAIVHGLFHKKGEKLLRIFFQKEAENHLLEVTIEDNGVGRLKSEQINLQRKKHKSFASSANEKRIELISQTLNKKIKVKIVDKIDAQNEPTGTLVIIQIPFMTA